MKIIRSVFSNGERLPFLYRNTPQQPVLVPFLYVVLKLRYKAYNTIQSQLRAIQAFYAYHEYLDNEDVDEQLINAQFDILLTSLEGFTIWLINNRMADNVAGRIGLDENSNQISAQTRDNYLRALKAYLQWCAQRYISPRRSCDTFIEQKFIDTHQIIEKRFNSHLLNIKPPTTEFRSLTDDQITAIRDVVHPQSPINPFKQQYRLRNQLIVELLLNTGIRKGELLKLKPRDVVKSPSGNIYLSIINREDDPGDPRADEPALKNCERTISLSPPLYTAISHYIDYERRPVRYGKPMRLSHDYLFVSERGKPLSTSGCSYIITTISNAIKNTQPSLINNLTPHDFRHTFATRFLEYLVDEKKLDMERAKDELRRICGWSLTSQMPVKYALRYISKSANQHNMDRASSAWKRYLGNGDDK